DALGAPAARSEIVFVESTVTDYQVLLADVNPNARIVILDGGKDGIQQIADYMAHESNVDAIHIVSHGAEGKLELGTAKVDSESMRNQYAEQLVEIGRHLANDADILVYGCDFAKGEDGRDAAMRLSFLTGADVAASDNLTGSSDLGGDWNLERAFGEIETSVAFGERAQSAFKHVLATLDWDTSAWTAGSTSNSYTIGGDGVTVAISDAGGRLVSPAPALTDSTAASPLDPNTGGLSPVEKSLAVRADFGGGPVGTEKVVLTLNFTKTGGASNVSFTIYDVDAVAGGYTDRLVITGNNGAVINPTSVTTGSTATFDGTRTVTGTAAAAASSNAGNVSVTFNQSGITQITISFESGQTSNPSAQQINLSDIAFTGINDAPTITSPAAVSVAEGTSTATVVYTATATDVDSPALTYSLSGTDSGAFSVDSTTGQVRFNSSPDFETKSSYSFNVVASDGSLSASQAVTLTVTDVAPAITSATTVSVAEGTGTGTVVYTASATDVAGGTVS